MYTSKVWSIGKSKKGEIEKTDRLTNPGPGAYEPKVFSKTAIPTWRLK